jgi:protein-disulfide isomerase/uncharacterized membrane protein
MKKARIIAALALCAAGGLLGLVLFSKHYGVPLLGEAVLAACGVGEGCDVVSQSRYSMFLGMPLAGWGLFFYGALFTLLAPALVSRGQDEDPASPSMAFLLVCLAIAIDFVLLGLQLGVIKAVCKFCVATYVVNLLLLGVLWPWRGFSRGFGFVFSSDSRPAFVSWVVALLFVAAAVVSGNVALADRKELAGQSILGIPLAPANPAPAAESSSNAAPGSLEAQLAEARAEALRWKNTLDNEKLLESYLNQKARNDFNAAPVIPIDFSRAPSQGPEKAPITVTVFSDFMCPYCRDLSIALKNYLPRTGNRVRLVYKHFPLENTCNTAIGQTVHPGACELSFAGVCAAESGRFWEFHDKVFARTWDRATREDVLGLGVAAGLDRSKLESCIASASVKGLVAKDIAEGVRASVGSTPTLLINGRKLSSTGMFLVVLEEERKRLGLQPIDPSVPKQEQ